MVDASTTRAFTYPLRDVWQFGDMLYWRVHLDRISSTNVIWRPYCRMSEWPDT